MRERGFFKWILLSLACVCCGLFFACDSCKDGDSGEIYYTVQLQSALDVNERRYSQGSLINEPQSPNKAGHSFVGWYNPATDMYWDFDKDVVSGDLLLVAHFKPTENTLVFESNDGEDKFISAPAYTGETRYLPECPFQRLGYRFLGWGDWHDGAVKYAAGDPFEVENRYVDYAMTYTFYAIWEAVECTVTFDANGGDGEMAAAKMYPERYYELPEPAFTNGNLALAGWSYTDDGTVDAFNGDYFVFSPKNWTDYDPEKGFTLYAVWEEYTDGLAFSCSVSRAIVTGYTGTDKAVHIPTGYMGRRCETIDLRAFKNNTLIESVTAGGRLSETHYGGGLAVSQEAFYGCVNLKRIDAARGVFSVLKEAFAGCTALQSFQFSADGYIDEKAFYGCTALQTVVWPQRVQELGSGAFTNCPNLKIEFSGENPAYKIVDGILYDRDQTKIFFCLRAPQDAEFVAPQSVTEIAERAFEGIAGLAGVTISSTVKAVGRYAFKDCLDLKSVTIEEGAFVSELGKEDGLDKSAFDGCFVETLTTNAVWAKKLYFQTLKTATITGGNLENTTFFCCAALENITILEGVEEIGSGTFYGCSSLAEVRLPSSLKTVKDQAFMNCAALEKIALPNGVTSIGDDAFYGCTSLQTVTLPSGLAELGKYVFYKCASLENIALPNGITKIGEGAFYECTSLKSVTLPSDVTELVEDAFFKCNGLEEIVISEKLDKVGNAAFGLCGALTHVYYQGTQTDWKKITIAENNSAVTSATVYYFSETEPNAGENGGYDGEYWRWVDGKPTVWKKETEQTP